MVKRKASAETRGSAEKGKEKDYTEVAESTEFTEKRNPSVPGRAGYFEAGAGGCVSITWGQSGLTGEGLDATGDGVPCGGAADGITNLLQNDHEGASP
jgi:hypothetical protein